MKSEEGFLFLFICLLVLFFYFLLRSAEGMREGYKGTGRWAEFRVHDVKFL